MRGSKKRPVDSDTDITDAELEAIYKKVDEDFEKNGVPTDDQLRREIDKMNADHPEPMASAEPNDGQYEVIVKVLAEGGGVDLYGLRTKDGWLFSRGVIDQSLMLMDEPEIRHSSGTVDSWPDALKLLDQYPWQHLAPRDVHPEFRTMVLEAVLERYKLEGKKNPQRLSDWKEICSVVGGQPTYCSPKDVGGESSDGYLYDE